MPRTRLISDTTIFEIIRTLLAESGPRAVTFATVAQKSGLSGPSLVQRYGTREAMLQLAMLAGWDALDAATEAAITAAPLSAKGASTLLKALDPDDLALPASELSTLSADFNDPVLRTRAQKWRTRMVQALSHRLGGGGKDKQGAEMLFAAWQGRMLWAATGTEGFRLRDLQRRLTRGASD